jgi:tryptophan 2,3-dioxygenase
MPAAATRCLAARSRHDDAVEEPLDSPSLTYSRYLRLDDLLRAQRPLSDEHDELLFIVIHQVYELWFKQLLHELVHLQSRLESGDSPHALHTLKRILTILKVVVAQIDVLETMTPRQFTSFRARLDAASGFQSAQFRRLEAIVGPALFDSFVAYLRCAGFDVDADDVQPALLDAYRRDGEPAQIAERLVDLDEGLQEWRYRHLKMVERTIGDKPGTGGSSGTQYLRSTLFKPAFPDLWAIRSRL